MSQATIPAREPEEPFGVWLRRRRKELGLKLGDIAAACDVKYQAVQNWENGGGISADHVFPLANILQAPPDEVLWRVTRT